MTHALIGLASAAFAIHLVDHLVAHDESGPLFAGAIALGVACITLAAAYSCLAPTVRGTVAVLFGAILLYGGTAYHLAPMMAYPPGSGTTDGTGLLATLGGALMTVAGAPDRLATGRRAHARKPSLARTSPVNVNCDFAGHQDAM